MTRGRLSIVFAIVAIVLAAAIWSVDWRFWSRYLSKPKTASELSVDWYQPQAFVTGNYQPLARNLSQDPAPFANALTIAQEFESRALLVVSGDEIVLERYWDGGEASTRHLTFSFHKTVSALLVGMAIEDGLIASIDDPIGKYLTEWTDDPRGKESLRSAMQMSAGYSHPSQEGGAFSEAARFSYGSDIAATAMAGGMEEGSAGHFEYSDRSAQLVGLALQDALRQSYADYLSERLWQPIQASDAAVVKSGPDSPVITYCCLMATAEDWLKIGILMRDHGRVSGRQIVPERWIETMTAPAVSNPNFGLFLWLGSPFNPERTYTSASPAKVRSVHPFAADDVFFLDGAGGQRIYISRSLDLVVVRLGAYRADWDDTRLFNAVSAAIASLRTTPKG